MQGFMTILNIFLLVAATVRLVCLSHKILFKIGMEMNGYDWNERIDYHNVWLV